jgi:hypothetical protein
MFLCFETFNVAFERAFNIAFNTTLKTPHVESFNESLKKD